MTKFPYISLPTPTGEKVYKPLIQLRLSYSKTHKFTDPVWGIIDSGSDVCLCHKNIGIWLGLNFKKEDRVKLKAANNQDFFTHKAKVILYVCGLRYECPIYFTDELVKNYPVILGQIGFFDRFKVCFDLKSREIEII